MTALNRKLFRDVYHLRGQLIAAALVVMCGVAAFVTMRSAYTSLLTTRDAYYSEYRFGDLFASVKRAAQLSGRGWVEFCMAPRYYSLDIQKNEYLHWKILNIILIVL